MIALQISKKKGCREAAFSLFECYLQIHRIMITVLEIQINGFHMIHFQIIRNNKPVNNIELRFSPHAAVGFIQAAAGG